MKKGKTVMEKEKLYKKIFIIAVIIDLIIFGSLLYCNRKLKNEVNALSGKILNIENRIEKQEYQIKEVDKKISNNIAESGKEDKQQEYENNSNNVAVKNLDKNISKTLKKYVLNVPSK